MLLVNKWMLLVSQSLVNQYFNQYLLANEWMRLVNQWMKLVSQ